MVSSGADALVEGMRPFKRLLTKSRGYDVKDFSSEKPSINGIPFFLSQEPTGPKPAVVLLSNIYFEEPKIIKKEGEPTMSLELEPAEQSEPAMSLELEPTEQSEPVSLELEPIEQSEPAMSLELEPTEQSEPVICPELEQYQDSVLSLLPGGRVSGVPAVWGCSVRNFSLPVGGQNESRPNWQKIRESVDNDRD